MNPSESKQAKKIRSHFPKKVKKACANCRRAHSRCDDKRPCSRCVAHLIAHTCDIDSSMIVRSSVSDPVVYAPSIQPSPLLPYPSIQRNEEDSRRGDPRAISWWNLRNRDLCLMQCSNKFAEVLGCPGELIINRLLLKDLFVNANTVNQITSRLDFGVRFGPVEAIWNTANGQTKSVLFWCNCKIISLGSTYDLELGVFNVSEVQQPNSFPVTLFARPGPQSSQNTGTTTTTTTTSTPSTPTHDQPITLFSNPPNRHPTSTPSTPSTPSTTSNSSSLPLGQFTCSTTQGLNALSESALSELAMLSISQQHMKQQSVSSPQVNTSSGSFSSSFMNRLSTPFSKPSSSETKVKSENTMDIEEKSSHRSTIHMLLN